MRVPDFLVAQDVPFESLLHPPAFTAQKRARFLHLPGRQVAKGVLLHGPSGYVLAVLPATHHVDSERLASVLGGPVRLAKGRELGVVDPGLGREWVLNQAREVDGAQQAGAVRRQRLLRTWVGRADGLAIIEVVAGIDAVDE